MGEGLNALLALGEGAASAMTHPPGSGIAIFFLALIFAWSAAAKLREPHRAALAFVDFGVSDRVRPALALALGGGEALLALSIAIAADQVIPLAAAALLLGIFGSLITRSLLAGKRFSCFCFGDEDAQLSVWTLARTVALILLAGLLVAAAIARPLHEGGTQGRALEVVAAVALVGMIALFSRFPRLVRWNSNPLVGEVDG
jgi:hypothetical protein